MTSATDTDRSRAALTRVYLQAWPDGDTDVLTWYDFHARNVTMPTVNWSHVENGLITAIRATFDLRPGAPPS